MSNDGVRLGFGLGVKSAKGATLELVLGFGLGV